MDPITLAMIPATLVGLLHTWKSERSTRQNAPIQEYIKWLEHHRHNQIVEMLQNNSELYRGVQQVLESNHDEVMVALGRIERVVSGVVSSIKTLNPIARQLPQLSEQAIDVLQKMNRAEASKVSLYSNRAGTQLLYRDGPGETDDVLEPRFIEDDLETLIEHGLLRYADNPTDDATVYIITRPGAEVGGE